MRLSSTVAVYLRSTSTVSLWKGGVLEFFSNVHHFIDMCSKEVHGGGAKEVKGAVMESKEANSMEHAVEVGHVLV